MSAIESAVAALYLRGLPRPTEPHPRAWPQVLSALRKAPELTQSGLAFALRNAGFSVEALTLEGRAWTQAERMVQSGLVLTVGCAWYPRRWVERLGSAAPAAFYARGALALLEGPHLAIVGSRRPPPATYRFAKEIAETAAKNGYCLVSGGAPGIDRAVSTGAAFVEIWPCGLSMQWGARAKLHAEHLALSLWPPRELFSAAGAMERNTLVYALAEAAFVGHARFKQGGTWHGATDAARRRLTRLIVSEATWPDDAEPARKALIGLGAATIADTAPPDLSRALEAAPLQPWLPEFSPSPGTDRALNVW